MNGFKATFRNACGDRGFVLPIVLTMGLIMILVALAAVAKSQNTRLNSFARSQTSGGSLMVAEGGVARSLAQLTKANNSVLLGGNYDVINPSTGKTYLGADGIFNNGDEENTPVNQWANINSVSGCNAPSQGTPDITYNGIIGDSGTYTLKAYRYHNASGTGTLLVEGKRKSSVTLLKVIVAVDPIASDFPGVVAVETMEMSGRNIIGSNGNVYYDPAFSANPSLTAASAPNDPNRLDYLNAIKSGINDNIEGKIIACKLNPAFDYTSQGTSLGTLKNSQTLFGSSNRITHYQTNKIELDNKIVDVDTTAGAVYVYVNGAIKMKGNSQIRNIRTDGIEPRVGDLQIILSGVDRVDIKDNSCIQNAFFYALQGNLNINSSGDGCASSGNTNIDGVVWVKNIFNDSSSDAGIAVPQDLSSLANIANSIGLSGTKKLGAVKSWQRQQL